MLCYSGKEYPQHSARYPIENHLVSAKQNKKKKCKTKYQYNPMKNGIIHHSNAINVFILIKSIARKFKHTRLVTSKG